MTQGPAVIPASIDEVTPQWLTDALGREVSAVAADRMPFEKDMARVDRPFFDALKALDQAKLTEHVRPWLTSDREVRDILKRRDKIVARFEALARERGEAVVFPFPPAPGAR